MKILWLSEMGFVGVIPKDNENLKSDVALIACCEAYHLPFNYPLKEENFKDIDFVMINCTKKFFTNPIFINRLDKIKEHCKVGFFQEGPIYDWQDWDPKEKALWKEAMKKIDIYFCSNQRDVPYYKAYVKEGTPVKWLKSPINLTRALSCSAKGIERKGTVVGGTGCIWYNGDTSLEIADAIKENILIPSMGRLNKTEPYYFYTLQNKAYLLPYVNFDGWIKLLSQTKFAVHMMPTFAAGSFHMNCAALGIPCIGSEEIDTQRLLFPKLSIHTYRDIEKGQKLLKRLKEDEEFYHSVVVYAQEKVKEWDIEVVGKELKEMIYGVL